MSLSISGSQFVSNGQVKTYVVSGIGSGYTLSSVVLPYNWSTASTGVIGGGSQSFDFNVDIGSGTIIVTYVKAGDFQSVYLDVYSGACRMGEEITQDCIYVQNNPIVAGLTPDCAEATECPTKETLCNFVLDVFADANDTANELKNDKTDFYGLQYMGNPAISAITLTLQKNDSACGGCNWKDKITFVEDAPWGASAKALNNGFGKFFAFGHAPDFTGQIFVDDYGNKYTGLLLYWIKVLQTYGEGEYRMKIVYISAIDGSHWTDYDVRTFCLHQWNCYNINGSVRIETINSGFRGNMNNNTMQIDFGAAWYGQMRLKGIFYEVKPNYNKEFNQYGDADYNSFKPVIHELIPKFLMDIKPAPGWVDWILSNYILLSDQILITDYNAANRKVFLKTPVINEGGIDTKDNDFVNSLAWSQISFSYGQNNLRRRND